MLASKRFPPHLHIHMAPIWLVVKIWTFCLHMTGSPIHGIIILNGNPEPSGLCCPSWMKLHSLLYVFFLLLFFRMIWYVDIYYTIYRQDAPGIQYKPLHSNFFWLCLTFFFFFEKKQTFTLCIAAHICNFYKRRHHLWPATALPPHFLIPSERSTCNIFSRFVHFWVWHFCFSSFTLSLIMTEFRTPHRFSYSSNAYVVPPTSPYKQQVKIGNRMPWQITRSLFQTPIPDISSRLSALQRQNTSLDATNRRLTLQIMNMEKSSKGDIVDSAPTSAPSSQFSTPIRPTMHDHSENSFTPSRVSKISAALGSPEVWGDAGTVQLFGSVFLL